MFTTIGKTHDGLSELGLWLALLALAGIATLSFVATMSRYFAGVPIGWAPDWAGYLLAASVFVAAPAVTRRGQHVSMDILASVIPAPWAQRILALVTGLATLTILAIMSWVIWGSLASAFRSGTFTAAGYPIPRWWLLAFVFYGFFSSGLHVLRAILALLGGRTAAQAMPHTSPEGF